MSDLTDHLRFYQDLGVAGVSRDPKWRARIDSRRERGAEDQPVRDDATLVPEAGLGQPVTIARSAAEALAAIREDLGDCTRCKLHTQGRRQIAAINPKVIVALGAFAAKTLTKTDAPISRLRGRAFEYAGATLIPTFHPSFLLRSPGYKREAWEDLKKALAALGRELPRPAGS